MTKRKISESDFAKEKDLQETSRVETEKPEDSKYWQSITTPHDVKHVMKHFEMWLSNQLTQGRNKDSQNSSWIRCLYSYSAFVAEKSETKQVSILDLQKTENQMVHSHSDGQEVQLPNF